MPSNMKRFSINCYGKQLTIEKIREEKAEKYKELKKNRGSKEWNWYFLRYTPGEGKEKKVSKKRKTHKKRQRKRRGTRKRRSWFA